MSAFFLILLFIIPVSILTQTALKKDLFIKILIFQLIIFSIQTTRAQDSSNVVNLQNPDLPQLEWLTFKFVNKLREEKRLPELVWDDVLARAAKDHADYLIKEKKISHFQTIKGKKTAGDRVKIHGGLIYTVVGENIVEVPLGVYLYSNGKKRSTVTYQASAITMAQLWKSSPGHYKNIISKDYNCTALAASYDKLTQRLIVVQVFGYSSIPSTKINLPDYSNHLLQLPKSKLPYGLKTARYIPKNQKAVNAFFNMDIDRGYITCSFKTAKKIFKGRKSGITQEFIPLQQFDSTSKEFTLVPNRRNGLHELNGELSKPVYRRKMLRYSRKHTEREYYIYLRFFGIKKPPRIFIYPLQPGGNQEEFNLFLVKSKRLEIYRSYSNIPSSLFDCAFPGLDFNHSFKPVKTEAKFLLHHKFDTVQFKIFYSPGAISIQPEIQEEIRKAFQNRPGKIVSVEGAAYASIEGNKLSNDQLAKDRMGQLMTVIKPYMDSLSVSPKIKMREQWVLFYKQIEGTRLHPLKKMKMDQVREYVNQNKTDTLLSKFLDLQRYITFTMIWREDFKEYLPVKSAAEVYDSLKTRIDNSEKPNLDMIRALEKAQLALYYKLAQVDSLHVVLPDVPYLERHPELSYHKLLFEYTVLKIRSDSYFYTNLHELGKSKYFPGYLKSQLVYNNLVLIFSKFHKGELSDLMDEGNLSCEKYRQSEFYLKKFKKIRCRRKRPGEILNPKEYYVLKEIPSFIRRGEAEKVNQFPSVDLWKNYYLYTIHSLYEFVPMRPEIYEMLPGIKKYFHPNDAMLTEEERLTLAYFYCAVKKYNFAKNLVEPLAIRPVPNKEALKLYLTLKFDDFEDEHEFVNYLISQFPRLGKEEWCDLWFNPSYLNFLMMEDLKLKNFYNYNCGR
jgi:uncharacterized protein YkwD